MSNESYSDYAVLTKEGLGADLGAHASDLRVVAFQSPVSLSNALKGVLGEDSDKCPMDAIACPWDTSNVELQHESDGYVRVVGKMITDHLEADLSKRIAKSFALVKVGAGSSSGNGGQSVSSIKARAEVPFKYGSIRNWTTAYDPLILEATEAGDSGNSLSVQFEVEEESYTTFLHVKVFDSSSTTSSTPVFYAKKDISDRHYESGYYFDASAFNDLSDNDDQSISITDYVTAVGDGEVSFKDDDSFTLQLSTETHASAQYNGLTFTAVRNGSDGNSLRVEFYVDDEDSSLHVSIYEGETEIYTASTSNNVDVDENTASVFLEAFVGLEKGWPSVEEYMGDIVVVSGSSSITLPTGDANKVTLNLSGGGVDSSSSQGQEPAEAPELSIEEVYAVASIEKGYDLGERNFVAFTITTVNNYKSVSFNPNAFATVEDLGSINGLDGLHIAYDKTSGDIKLLDKDGKVLDQANIGIDSETIIADGDEGYKYVKTDRDQDIHSAKAFMPDGKTAWESFEAVGYEVQKAALLVDLRDLNDAIDSAQSALEDAESELADAQNSVDAAQQALDANDDPDAAPALEEDLSSAQSTLNEKESALEKAKDDLDEAKAAFDEEVQAVRRGDYSNVLGIRVISDQGYTDYFIGGSYNNSKIDASDVPFLAEMESDAPEGLTPVYSQSAFVWTVGSDVGESPASGEDDTRSFAQQMNANAQALGFHIGDDIPLGTNIADLLEEMANGDDFDTVSYMHGDSDNEDYIDELVDEQRNLAKAELVAWNARHPALEHDEFNGTIISKDGVDIKNGTIRIGNGTANENGNFTKQFELSTNLPARAEGTNEHHGLNISLKDASDGHFHEIVTITDVNYISGAPECLALLKFVPAFYDQTSGSSVITPARVETKRITANFSVEGSESNGIFSITITDNREYTRIHTEDHIVEIIPVYKPGADPDESVPALQPIHTIGEVTNHAGIGEPARLAIDVRCSQVLDWAQSIGLPQSIVQDNPQVIPDEPSSSLYLIVKLY